MGLEEKRQIEAAQKGWLPAREKEANEICGGGKVAYEVDWKSFDGDAKGISWCENNGPAIVSCAFRVICADDLGKQAVRDGVKKVVFRNVKEAKDKAMGFEGGVLTLTCAFAQSPAGRFKDDEIRKCLEAGL